jgi:hypothetical protein
VRPSRKRIGAYVAANAGRPVETTIARVSGVAQFVYGPLEAIYRAAIDRRAWARRDAREAAQARALFGKALRDKSRAIAGAAAQMHRKGDPRAPIWDRRAGIYAQVEAERQQAEAERIERIGYALTEQAEMLDIVDQTRPERQRQRTGRAPTRGGVCSPQTTPIVVQPDLLSTAPAPTPYHAGYVSEMIARLKNNQESFQ